MTTEKTWANCSEKSKASPRRKRTNAPMEPYQGLRARVDLRARLKTVTSARLYIFKLSVIVLRFNRSFWKETTSRMFYNALLTAVIVFCTALATRVAGTELTKLVVVSAGVSAVAAFCQILLEYIRHEREAEQDSNR
jgi:hypothetical protein